MKYYIGYFNQHSATKAWDFVIHAETHAKAVAMFIRDSYMEAFKRIGMSVQIEIFDDRTLPAENRYSE